MNILICSKISIPAKDRTLPAWEYVRSLGHTVWMEGPDIELPDKPDVLISMGVTVMDETFRMLEQYPNVPLFSYNWDCYEWVWTNPRPGEYDYKRYGELLKLSTEVWTPSYCTSERTKQWWGIKNTYRILSACPYWDYEDIKDQGYILCALREIPDPYWGRVEEACDELGLPLVMTKHEQSYEDYQKKVAQCKFIVSPLYELSTGGLTIMEGYYLGKNCLLSDSKWHGGIDYMSNRAHYFQHDDYDNLKDKLWSLYNNTPKLNITDCQNWIKRNYSDKMMMDQMLDRVSIYV